MDDLRERLQGVDRVAVPDLWAEARDRASTTSGINGSVREDPRGREGIPWRRLGTVVVAFAVFAGAVVFAWRIWAPTDRSPADIIAMPPSIAQIIVPDVVGLNDQRAFGALHDARLHWVVALRAIPGTENGYVVSTDPPAGTPVGIGTRVQVLIATEVTPLPPGAADALDCDPSDHVAFGGPSSVDLPGGAGYITVNMPGIQGDDEVVQVTFEGQAWNGLWHVIRDGSVVAVVDYNSLDGEACLGSDVAGA